LASLATDRHARAQRPSWALLIGSPVVLALAILNNFVHSRDAWTAVVPEGLGLSAITVVAIIITAWLGSATFFREPLAADYTGFRQ
jgi:uncharacterized membrane protein